MSRFEKLLARLKRTAERVDGRDRWPARQIELLQDAGVLRWGLPEEYGGEALPPAEMLLRYAQLASACLTTTFILTQRNAACQRIAASDDDSVKTRLLPDLTEGKLFATVGISHLTTSRQHMGRPSVQAMERPYGYILDGQIPWVTGAAHADFIVAGGTLVDGRQILIAVPRQAKGVTIGAHLQLMALTSSHTASLTMHSVTLPPDLLLAGPVDAVMKSSSGGAGSLVTSALALGLSQRGLDLLHDEATQRSELKSTANAFGDEFTRTRQTLLDSSAADASGASTAPSAIDVRQQANSLALRIAQACLAVSKGAGYMQGHPAERLVREAMFFLVWSCPQPVVAAALQELTCQEI